MELRKANKDEISIIQDIAYITWPVAYGDILSQEKIDYMLGMMYSTEALTEQMDNGHIFLIINENNKDLGFVSFENNYSKSSKTKIQKIYILPEAQGKGVGRLLINEAEKLSKDIGNTMLFLNVNRHNKAQFMYQKLGFEISKSEDVDIGNGFFMNDYVMEKVIE
ncbi:GNAT family N-acetyltransferase [Lacihabitans sp. LS3-19]|uniref:GNAT family N-acetyltransferase n=1 Tax=Lacihabitans sp. LS3-19 TaxID=2487335 RepID=UPI0020CF62B8|nr:GNAT family N-acetyltransferase [Lacihabitans sp. LS3-19]MCP9769789.1 GNAT family N-acetyltransferase [Lacihabitans sp. LS3-19]